MPLPRPVRVRIAVVAALFLTPLLALSACGILYLRYHLRLPWYVYLPPIWACMMAGYWLARRWTRSPVKAPTDAEPPPDYWTDRDRAAWAAVEEHIATRPPPTVDDFGDLEKGAKAAEEMAMVVARIYHPTARDPFGHLTLPELLACGELVSQDMAKLVADYVPGSHLFSVNDLKRVRTAVDRAATWYPRLRNAYWLAQAVIAPWQTAAQVVTTKAGFAPAFAGIEQNVVTWFQAAQARQLGRYLIELNSGRLRVGAARYRELMKLHLEPPVGPAEARRPRASHPREGTEVPPGTPSPHEDGSPGTLPITVALVGPVKAGKSSLVNAILGEERAATDVLPLTPGAVRYTLDKPGQPRLSVMDTAGFGNDGASEADVRAAAEAAGEADVLLVVVPARSAARKPESDFLDRVIATVQAQPHLRMPPTVCVLSHVDLLTPAREWAPPYDWRHGGRPKEASIKDAVSAAVDTFGGRVVDVLPVCTAPGKEFGRDELLARVSGFLGEARGVAFLRALHAEAAADRYRRVAGQVLNVGAAALKAFLDPRKQ
jgi:hypothetical protein